MPSSLKYYWTLTSSLSSNTVFFHIQWAWVKSYSTACPQLYGYADLLHVHIKSSISMLNNLFQKKIFLITIAILYFNNLLSSIRISVRLRRLHTCTDQTLNNLFQKNILVNSIAIYYFNNLLRSIRISVRLRRLHTCTDQNDENIC